eukprot:scaffold225539_cov27-Tisochrysis_lutea.AAC.2
MPLSGLQGELGAVSAMRSQHGKPHSSSDSPLGTSGHLARIHLIGTAVEDGSPSLGGWEPRARSGAAAKIWPATAKSCRRPRFNHPPTCSYPQTRCSIATWRTLRTNSKWRCAPICCSWTS